MFSISQVLVGSAPFKPYGFDKGCKHTYIHTLPLDYIDGDPVYRVDKLLNCHITKKGDRRETHPVSCALGPVRSRV